MITASEARRTTEERIKRLNAATINDINKQLEEVLKTSMQQEAFAGRLNVSLEIPAVVINSVVQEWSAAGYAADFYRSQKAENDANGVYVITLLW